MKHQPMTDEEIIAALDEAVKEDPSISESAQVIKDELARYAREAKALEPNSEVDEAVAKGD